MLGALAGQDVPWESLQVLQVDERVAPAGQSRLKDSLAGDSQGENEHTGSPAGWRSQHPSRSDLPCSSLIMRQPGM
jgi:hypothetical protein